MTAQAQDEERIEYPKGARIRGVLTDAILWAGAMVGVAKDSPYLRPMSAAADLICLGVNRLYVDATDIASGTPKATVDMGTFGPFASATAPNAVTDSHVGQLIYALDDKTMSLTDQTGTLSPSGFLEFVDSAGGLWVDFDPAKVAFAIAAASAGTADVADDLADAVADIATNTAAIAATVIVANAAVPKASVQRSPLVTMVAGSAAFTTGVVLTAGSVVFPVKEVEDPAASGTLTVGAITPGGSGVGAVTITSSNGAEVSKIRLMIVG